MDAQPARLQLNRILASANFADAERARNFLRFVVERVLEGHASDIKESVIAVEVLNRPPSFDSKSDPIVRVEAGRLRDRLSAYYEAEGVEDAVLISLPKGRYVPEFTERRPWEAAKSVGVLRLSILPPESASFESFAISPDGRHLAFTAAVNAVQDRRPQSGPVVRETGLPQHLRGCEPQSRPVCRNALRARVATVGSFSRATSFAMQRVRELPDCGS